MSDERRQELIDKLLSIIKASKQATDPVSDANREEPTDMTAPRKSKEQNTLLAALRDVAGATFQQSDILFEGTQLTVPERRTTRWAIKTLSEYERAQEEYIEFHRDFRYRPGDGAAATERALHVLTGSGGIGMAIKSFFGDIPPARITIPNGVDSTMSVPWGRLMVPLFQGDRDLGESYIHLGSYNDPEYGVLFRITAFVPKKYEPEVNGLFSLIQQELEENSIYKGQAVTGAEQPEFLDLSDVDPAKVIYSDDVMAQMNAHLWGPIRFAEQMRAHGIPTKRSVLFHGPYGTGKTLGGLLTAQVSVANDRTFIMCRPGKDDPFEVLQTAQLYAPATVFIEDIDTYSRSAGMAMDQMSLLLDKFDGIEAKSGGDIMVVMTTNHEKSITKGMLRPGRLDALIEIAHLDRNGVKRMVESHVEPDGLDDVDYDVLYAACEGYLPAFVAESVRRAMLASIVRGNGELLPLNTADLVNGAMSLRPQFDLMQQATEVETPPTLDAVFRQMVADAIDGMQVLRNEDEYEWATLTTQS